MLGTAERTSKILCVARNYSDIETEREAPIESRMLEASIFLKPASALSSLINDVNLSGYIDVVCETELALLLGCRINRSSNGCSTAEASNAILGVGVALDFTRKDLQNELQSAGKPWELAKGFDGACPVSGFIRTQPQNDWRVQLEHNGESALNQPLSDMILKPTELIQLLSKYFTLDPGDLILTGTPTKPKLPPRLKTGDTIIASVGPGIRVETNVV